MSKARATLYALVLASALSLLVPFPGALRAVVGFLQVYYLPGLVFLLFLGNRRISKIDAIFFAPLLSPVLLSLLVYGIYLITGAFDGAVRLSLLACYILLALALWRRTNASPGESPPVPRAVFVISSVFAGVIALSYLVNSYLLVYTDAWHHISVVREILDRGLPPMDPRFPDIPIRYMWFYHLFHAIGTALSGLEPRYVLASFNVVNAFVFPYMIARLVSVFTGKRRVVLGASVLACLGLESAGWVLWPLNLARTLFGDVRGAREIARIIGAIELDGVGVTTFLTPPWTYLMNLHDKFITITAMNVTFNLFLLCFILVIGAARTGRRELGTGVLIFFASLGALLFHVVTGMALLLTLIGSGILLAAMRRVKHETAPPRFVTLTVPCCALLAMIAGLPYFVSLTGGGSGGGFIRDHVHFGYMNLLTIIAPLAVLLPFTTRAIARIFGSSRIEYGILGMWLASLLAISLVLDLPGLAENKVVFYLFLLMAPFIAWMIVETLEASRGVRRTLLVLWFAVLFIVPPILTVRGFMLERPGVTRSAKRVHISAGEREIYEWIERNTPIGAVVIEKNFYNLMPVYARRRNFLLFPTFIRVHDYRGEKVERYIAVRDELFAGRPLGAETVEFLRGRGMAFYLVLWRAELEEEPALAARFGSHPEWFEKRFENNLGIVYYVKRTDEAQKGRTGEP